MTTTFADLILVDGQVLTHAPVLPVASAVATKSDRIIAVGDDSLCDELRGSGSEGVSLGGAMVTPRLVDPHMHPAMGMLLTDRVDRSGCVDLELVRAALTAAAADLPPETWLTGRGLDPNVFGDVAIGYEALDTVFHVHLFLLTLLDGQSVIASREARRRTGIEGPRSFGARATIACDDAGREAAQAIVLNNTFAVNAVNADGGPCWLANRQVGF